MLNILHVSLFVIVAFPFYSNGEMEAPDGSQRIYFSPDQVTMGGGPDPDKEENEHQAPPEIPKDKIIPAKNVNGVYDLKTENFDIFLEEHDIVMVMMYVPICHECLYMIPEMEAISAEMLAFDPPVTLAKVDAESERYLGESYMRGYPTVKLFYEGEILEYKDESKKLVDIIAWVKKTVPGWKKKPSSVLTLTTENFHDTIDNSDFILVEFYAPWCGHCKRLKPEYEKAANILARRNPPIQMAWIDVVKEKNISEEFKITHFPTLKIFRRGQQLDYNGPRTSDGIVKYLIENSLNTVKSVKTLKELKELRKEEYVFILGSFQSEKDALYQPFQKAMTELKTTFSCAMTFDSGLQKHFKLKPNQFAVLTSERFSSKYEPESYIYDEPSATQEEIVSYVKSHQIPLVGEYNRHTETMYDKLKEEDPFCVFFYTVDFSQDMRSLTQLWRSKIVEVAYAAKDKVTIAIADETRYVKMSKNFGLEDSSEDINLGCYVKNKRFALRPPMEEFNVEQASKFVLGILDGTSRRFFKSAMIPRENNKPVKIIVAKIFEPMVEDTDKDVVVLFYTPWSDKCKKFLPIYEKLAAELETTEPNLLFGKFDVSTNGHRDPPYGMRDYPTFYFSPSGKKTKPVLYESDLTESEFRLYLEDNSMVSFSKKPDTGKTEL